MLLLLLWAGLARGQEAAAFEKSSLAWRTALHFDPGAEAPLRSLTGLYQKAGRLAELTALYTAHVEQYPQDEGAAVVLARLLVETSPGTAGPVLEQARRRHPASALLARVRHDWLAAQRQPGALEALEEAVRLEAQVPARRMRWLADLVGQAGTAGREGLLHGCLKALLEQGALAPGQRVFWARRCLDSGMAGAALQVLDGADMSTLGGEEAVEAAFTQVRVFLANGRRAEAAARASTLLGMLGADHGRRREALLLCWQTEDAAQRQARLAATARAWQAAPGDELAALTHGDLLLLDGRAEAALGVWRQALEQAPDSRLLEERLFHEMEARRLEEPLLDLLAARLRAQPGREDLRLRQARQLLRLGRLQSGLEAMRALLTGRAEAEKTAAWLQAARWLRQQNLFTEAAAVLGAGLESAAGRWDLRKEMAELLYLQKRDDEARQVLEAQDTQSMTVEMRLEAVPFLLQHQLWPMARRVLEEGLRDDAGVFDLRLLLARVEAQAGDAEAAARQTELCRAHCDTDARYAAWLAAAWQQAEQREQTQALLQAERARLWPAAGRPWEPRKLGQLAVLAAHVSESKLKEEAEPLLRQAIADPALPAGVRQSLRLLWIALLDGEPARRRELEQEIRSALDQAGEAAAGLAREDLRLRLLLMYLDAGRADLARQTLAELRAGECQDAGLIQRGTQAALQLGEQASAQALARRLVLLQPAERAHWLAWTRLLAEAGQEEELRMALREMGARAAEWGLDGPAQDLLRQHLCASAWRSITTVLSEPQADGAVAEACLAELETLERQPARRGWLAWVRGLLSLRQADAARLAEARAALAGAGEWIDLPDGVSLSRAGALRLLRESPPPPAATTPSAPADYTRPGRLAWAFQPQGGAALTRWGLDPDGARVLAQDQHGWLHALDRASGRLLWRSRVASPPVPAVISTMSSGEVLNQPLEWCLAQQGAVIHTADALTALSWADGQPLWSLRQKGLVRLAAAGGLVLCWQPQSGVLDALEAATGRLRWSTPLPELGRPPKSTASQPVWLSAGLQVDGGRALVWGSGTAVVMLEDGAVLWKAGTGTQPLSFPLELDATAEKRSQAAFSSPAGFSVGSQLAAPVLGYPGAYGGVSAAGGSPWLHWGAEGSRWLHGDAVWLSSTGGVVVRCSLQGFPTRQRLSVQRAQPYSRPGWPLGTAGRALLLAGAAGVSRVMPGGQPLPLLEGQGNANATPAAHLMPAAALAGSVVLAADMEQVRAVEALTGTLLWQQPWQGRAAEIIRQGRAGLAAWQSMRWSSAGITFYDGSGRSQVIDWRALASHGDLVVPAGLGGLLCLRCGG